MTSILGTSEVATRAGVSAITVLRRIHDGTLSARKLGRDWIISDDDALAGFVRAARGAPCQARRQTASAGGDA